MNKKTYLIYKPYLMLSQFTQEIEGQQVLAQLSTVFAKDVYPVGRLDADSEGLLLLSSDKSLTEKLLNPKNKHERTYFVQVEGIPTETALEQLRTGVGIRIEKNKDLYQTQGAKVSILSEEEVLFLPERLPAVRFRASIPTTWISLTLSEGKNRQVRKMTAAVGFPTLRLVRVAIGGWQLAQNPMISGEVRELTAEDVKLIMENA
jgi:23S rRNA pseudouridine2457 synthase